MFDITLEAEGSAGQFMERIRERTGASDESYLILQYLSFGALVSFCKGVQITNPIMVKLSDFCGMF